MKKRPAFLVLFLGLIVVMSLAVSCSDSASSPDAFPIEFSGCDFAGATVAYVEFFEGATKVAYGYGNLAGGNASFTMKDVDTDADWYPTLGVAHDVKAYCFAGSPGDPVPAKGYWATWRISHVQNKKTSYSNLTLYNSYFHEE